MGFFITKPHGILIGAALGPLVCLAAGSATAPAVVTTRPSLQPGASIEGPFLIRVPAVQRELALSSEQRERIEQMMTELDGPLWRSRDLPSEQGQAERRRLGEKIIARLPGVLSIPQQARFVQIILWYEGPSALLRDSIRQQLGVSDAQQVRLEAILREYDSKMSRLNQQIREGRDQRGMAKAAAALRQEERRRVLTVLAPDQRHAWRDLLGPATGLENLQPMLARAPELVAGTWINSEPLTLAALRGRVVLVHFWTFGCINCVRNQPTQKAWFEKFGPRGLVMIGIHTPETARERDAEAVTQAAARAGLKFPILIDNEKRNWDAWANNLWPATYLIDRRGFVRYWWYGEFAWQGARGEPYIREGIETLLAETSGDEGD